MLHYESRTSATEEIVIVAARGEIDIYTAPEFKLDLHTALTTYDQGMMIDFSAVEFIDSTGLGVLVGVLRRLNEQGRPLALVITSKRIAKIFAITGLDKTFEIAGTRREAAALMAGERTARAA